MGYDTNRGRIAKAALAAITATLLALTFTVTALAGPPNHPRTPAQDISGLNQACGAAVDTEGDVYAASAGEDKIKVYDPDHDLIASIANTNDPCGLAVNSRGALLVAERGTGNVVRYLPDAYPLTATPTYSPAQPIDASGEATAISIDAVDDTLFIAKGDRIEALTSEVQQIQISAAIGGSFKLKFQGQETASIPHNASTAEVQAALEGLAAIGVGDVSVSLSTSGTTNAYRISFRRDLGYLDLPQTEALSSLSGNEIQKVEVKASAGTYKLSFEGEQSAPIAFNAPAGSLEAALEALGNLDLADVTVTGGPGSPAGGTYTVAFAGAYAGKDIRQMLSDPSALTGTATVSTTTDGAATRAITITSGGLGIDETQQVNLEGAGGSFKLKFEGQETASIAFNAPARKAEGAGSVEAALEALSNVAPGDVSVTRSSGANTYLVTFEGALAAKDVGQLETITALLPNEIQKVTVDATAGAYNLTATTGLGKGTTTVGSKNISAVSTSLGAYQVGDAISGPGMPLGATITAVGAGTLEISANASASGKDVTLTATETSAAIAFNAFANTGEGAGSVEAALEALTGLDTADVSVTGGPGGPGGVSPYFVTFEGAFGGRNVPLMTRKKAGITGDATLATMVEGASITSLTNLQGWNGRIGEGDLGEAQGVGAYADPGNGTEATFTRYLYAADSETDEVKVFYASQLRSLKLRKTIAGVDEDRNPETPDQELGFGPEGTSVGVDQGNGHFLIFDAAHGVVDELEATGEFLDQIVNSDFEDAEPVGLAVRPHRSEVQNIHIDASGGSFKLGFEGEETDAIVYGEKGGVVEEALEELAAINKGDLYVSREDQKSNQDNYLIGFKGGLGNRDIEQISADASGLTGGAQTATATTTKEGRGPGQLYVGAGSGSGAKLLAFAALVTPARAPLPELSRVLTGARSVATDGFGNVYVGAEAAIHVYSPTGEELTTIAVSAPTPYDLALDSAGNLYVLEGSANEERLTYYVPGAYPPQVGTPYTRHEPLLLTPMSGLASVGVNPDDDHVFVVGKGSNNTHIYEFSSAAEGSAQLSSEFAISVRPGGPVGVGVSQHEGGIFFSGNPGGGAVHRVDPDGTEILSRMFLTIDPSRVRISNPNITVDQSNGHVIASDAGTQEYEASGAFVGEIDREAGFGVSDVAIDNSCALHDPPLTEATTPTCAEFDPANGNLYIAHDDANDTEFPYDVTAYGPLSYGEPPAPETGVATAIGPTAATLHGTVNPRGFELEECAFEYIEDAEYEQNLADEDPAFGGASAVACVETPAEIGDGSEAVDVHADASGIEPQAKRYRFRLLARNQFGEGAADPSLFGPPLLTTKTAQPIFYDEATLRADVDPSGLATAYHFEYGLGAGEYTQSTPEAQLDPADGEIAIEGAVVGLAEGTEYHFRAVIENEASTVEGPDQTLVTQQRPEAQSCPNVEYRTGLSTFLPDCRAYELVTPAETRGQTPVAFTKTGSGEGFFNTSFTKLRGEGAGDSVAYGINGLPGFDGTGRGDSFRADRSPGAHPSEGWMSDLFGFSFAQAGGDSPDRHGVSPDLDYWLEDVGGGETSSEETFPGANYMRVPAGTANSGCSPDPALEFELVGCASLGTDPAAQGRYVSAGGTHVIFASKAHLEDEAAPVGTNALYDREAGSDEAEVISVMPDGTAFGNGEGATYVASTEDGTAVVFSVGGALYLHRDGVTTQVAAAPNAFAGISEDGERVFYLDNTIAVGGSPPSPAGLHACDTEAGPCAGPGAHAPLDIAANSNFVNVSPDGSRAFVSSEDALTAPGEENQNGEHAEASKQNLYEWDGTGLGFVAILADEDLTGFGEINEELLQWPRAIYGQGLPSDFAGRALSPTRSTADGGVLLFQSHAQLTPYDNGGHGEIYRYAEGQIQCVSCDPSGAPASSTDRLQTYQPFGVGNTDTLIPNLTDDGQRAFFQSADRLLPEDANSAIDVYEWTAQGSGDCSRASGCLALISSGQGEASSYLFAMTADGSDVFFVTPEKLVGQDITGSPSIYDARVEGGIPDKPAAAPCQGDACQGQGTPPPPVPTPSSTGQGSGNVIEGAKKRSCAKGKRRVKGRCVKKSNKQKSKKKSDKRSHRQANHDRGASR